MKIVPGTFLKKPYSKVPQVPKINHLLKLLCHPLLIALKDANLKAQSIPPEAKANYILVLIDLLKFSRLIVALPKLYNSFKLFGYSYDRNL